MKPDWNLLRQDLHTRGFATTGPLLRPEECAELTSLYSRDELFRSRVVMARHGFGLGEYKYFSYPLPSVVQDLRSSFYEQLAPVANDWAKALRLETRYPARHEQMLERCHAAGQGRPTALVLKYGPGDYNCLHQDLYGEHVFPLQATFLLSRPGLDFEGGEFVLVEQRPRMQSRAEVVPLVQGEAVIFAVHHRPRQGARGVYRVNMRHGVSTVRAGSRYTMGIIFHDAA
ncbi:MAG TPA: 2OG-Fe(II) oxygenase [Bryobacteraceae bacterium]|nr:2OG-Fe(II) oxygenase [Bryobacteraceae bacterium]